MKRVENSMSLATPPLAISQVDHPTAVATEGTRIDMPWQEDCEVVRTESREQRAESREQRAESREQRAESSRT